MTETDVKPLWRPWLMESSSCQARKRTLRLSCPQPGRETRRKQAVYDAGGQLIAEESATGLRTFYQRDAIGRIIELTMPGGGRWLRLM